MPLPQIDKLSVLDAGRITELREQVPSDPTLFNRLLAIFKDEGPTLIQELREGLAKGDVSEIHEVMHKVKGSAASMGATRIFALANFSVELCRAGGLTSSLNRLPEVLQSEYENYLGEAEKYVE